MKPFFLFCAICCFLAPFRLPIEYYTFLRIIISLGTIYMIYHFLKFRNYYWLLVFVTILVLFNPVFPIHLYRKNNWMPIDMIVGTLFFLFTVLKKKELVQKEKTIKALPSEKAYTRDRIISPKKQN
jgi:hypothetical protein